MSWTWLFKPGVDNTVQFSIFLKARDRQKKKPRHYTRDWHFFPLDQRSTKKNVIPETCNIKKKLRLEIGKKRILIPDIDFTRDCIP